MLLHVEPTRFYASNIFENTNKSKINKQTINEKEPAICMKTQYDENVDCILSCLCFMSKW